MFDIDFKKNRVHPNYFTQDVAITEVELDDVDISLNSQIDIDQIEGSFVQEIGFFTMKELIWGDEKLNKWIQPGELFTHGVDTYKIP
ncbi:unnamed protein product [Rotaria sp. Silwood2]|nr:unnamed protein product [Rotaria sp. Silwood2]